MTITSRAQAYAAESPVVPSGVRTAVPVILALLAKAGLDEADVFNSGLLTLAVAWLVAQAYYIGVRVLERLKDSRWGWLLGYPAQPTYEDEYVGQHRADD